MQLPRIEGTYVGSDFLLNESTTGAVLQKQRSKTFQFCTLVTNATIVHTLNSNVLKSTKEIMNQGLSGIELTMNSGL